MEYQIDLNIGFSGGIISITGESIIIEGSLIADGVSGQVSNDYVHVIASGSGGTISLKAENLILFNNSSMLSSMGGESNSMVSLIIYLY